MQNRNTSIDLLKFLATIFITNSHMVTQWGDYSILAQGGYEGNYIFFFCSGYTLLMRPMGGGISFKEWYMKRIRRIYPSLIAIAFISCLLWSNNENIIDIIIARKYWFVSAIMAQYVLLFIVGSFFRNKIPWMIILTFLVASVCFMFWDHSVSIWQGEYISRYVLSFNAMLLGGYVAINENRRKRGNLLIDTGLLVLLYIIFLICGHYYHKGVVIADLLRSFPLYGFVYFLYRVGSNPHIKGLINSKYLSPIILIIGGLSLEIYIVQPYLLNDNYNDLFPLNLVILFIQIVTASYIVRCLARLIIQLFQTGPISFKKIVSLY